MAEIQLSKGKVALVDDEDYEMLTGLGKWTLHGEGYGYRFDRTVKPNVCLMMHRVIMDAPKGFDVDHINGNRLDNQRANLRIASRTLNNYNRSSTKGIEISKHWSGAVVRIRHNYARYYIGRFADFEEAKHVRDSIIEQLMEVC